MRYSLKRTLVLPLVCLLLVTAGGCQRAKDSSSTTSRPGSSSSSSQQSSAGSSAGSSSSSEVPSSSSSSPSSTSTGNGHVVCIDPGHQEKVDLSTEQEAPGSGEMKTKNPGGAEGVATKKPEYELNLEVSLKLRDKLVAEGYKVVMTRETNGGNISNIGRAQVANDCAADIFLRIHADTADEASVRGISILVPGSQFIKSQNLLDQSKKVAQYLMDGLVASTGAKNRGFPVRNDMTGFNWCTRPMVLLEMGFMSNADEDRLLFTEDYQNKLVAGMVSGIDKYFADKANASFTG